MNEAFTSFDARQLREHGREISELRTALGRLERIVGGLLMDADARKDHELEQGEKK